MVDRRVNSVKACVTEYLRKECVDLNKVASDSDDDKDDDNDDGDDANSNNSKDIGVVEIGTGEALTMLDGLVNLKDLSKEDRNSLLSQ